MIRKFFFVVVVVVVVVSLRKGMDIWDDEVYLDRDYRIDKLYTTHCYSY